MSRYYRSGYRSVAGGDRCAKEKGWKPGRHDTMVPSTDGGSAPAGIRDLFNCFFFFFWARAHQDWLLPQWRKVLSSDESRFGLVSDDYQERVWRERG
nr:unnamed protein product [Callosobruchus chinensis]